MPSLIWCSLLGGIHPELLWLEPCARAAALALVRSLTLSPFVYTCVSRCVPLTIWSMVEQRSNEINICTPFIRITF